jgi:DNA-binding transcriptional LysR family regulator
MIDPRTHYDAIEVHPRRTARETSIELRDLRYFVVLAEELHFARAAKRLHISPPPLTQRIKKLEAETGVLLFHRTKRTVALTAAGLVLLEEARRLLQHASRVTPILHRAARGETGSVRVGVVGSAIFSHARNLQARMSRNLPDVRLIWHELSSVAQIESIRENQLDVGLLNTPIEHEGVALGQPLRESLVAVMSTSHALAKRTTIDLSALRNELFIVGARHLSPGYYDRFISACNVAGFSPNVDHQAGHLFTYISLVSIGAGVSLVPASMADAGLAGVSYVRIRGSPLTSEVSLAWSKLNPSPIVLRVLRIMQSPSMARAGNLRSSNKGKLE